MKRYALLVLLVFMACEDKLVEKPEDLIAKDKMISILYDIAILNAAKEINSDVMLEYEIDPTAFVLNQYGVDSLQFINSDLYYASVPKDYDAIYAAVKERLEKENERLDEIRKQEGDSARQQVIKRNSQVTN